MTFPPAEMSHPSCLKGRPVPRFEVDLAFAWGQIRWNDEVRDPGPGSRVRSHVLSRSPPDDLGSLQLVEGFGAKNRLEVFGDPLGGRGLLHVGHGEPAICQGGAERGQEHPDELVVGEALVGQHGLVECARAACVASARVRLEDHDLWVDGVGGTQPPIGDGPCARQGLASPPEDEGEALPDRDDDTSGRLPRCPSRLAAMFLSLPRVSR